MSQSPEISKPREAIIEAAITLFGERGYTGINGE